MLSDRQPSQDRRRFALGAGRYDDCFVGRQVPDLPQSHQHIVGDVEVAQLAGHFGVVGHRPPGDRDLTVVLYRHVHDLLDAGDERRKGRHNHAPWGVPHHLVKGIVQHCLRRSVARTIGVGAVGEQHQHAAAAELGQLGVIGWPAVHRRVIELEVAAVHDQPGRRCDAQAHSVRDGMTDVVGLDGEGAYVNDVARGVGVEGGLFQHMFLLQLDLDQASRQPRGVDRCIELLQEVGQCADMVLMAVGDDDCTHPVCLIAQIAPVWDDVINPQHV